MDHLTPVEQLDAYINHYRTLLEREPTTLALYRRPSTTPPAGLFQPAGEHELVAIELPGGTRDGMIQWRVRSGWALVIRWYNLHQFMLLLQRRTEDHGVRRIVLGSSPLFDKENLHPTLTRLARLGEGPQTIPSRELFHLRVRLHSIADQAKVLYSASTTPTEAAIEDLFRMYHELVTAVQRLRLPDDILRPTVRLLATCGSSKVAFANAVRAVEDLARAVLHDRLGGPAPARWFAPFHAAHLALPDPDGTEADEMPEEHILCTTCYRRFRLSESGDPVAV
ncbi:MAG: hypothetical protein KatS3mg082_1440 [Nitrospiraceae bacterium]|nr:MAG: hypothetical protein KatS3mg082_1440 [Nitrospiraceae bacterium]